jgi:hypothetical protein
MSGGGVILQWQGKIVKAFCVADDKESENDTSFYVHEL